MLMKMRGQMQKGRNQKGFTLVELMVVVVIIGVLVAIAVPVYSNVTAKAEKSACQANQRTIDGAVTQWLMVEDNTGYPSLDDLVDDGFLQSKPACPTEGGGYTLPTAAGEQTTCSAPGHSRASADE